jgi:hypothetical protein
MKKFWVIMIFGLLFTSCKKESEFVDYDMVQHGLSIKIKTPVDPEVKVTDMGIAKDITVKKGDNYNVQIISSDAVNYNVSEVIKEKREEVEAGAYFSEIIMENEHGFVFEKKIDENNVNYDFRVVKIQGDTEYDFQTGLLGKFTKEDVMKMFESVQ